MYKFYFFYILKKLVKNKSGVTAVEYGLIVALLSVSIIGAVSQVGEITGKNFTCIAERMSGSELCSGQVLDTGFDSLQIKSASRWDLYQNGQEVIAGWSSTGTGEVEVGENHLYGLPPSPTNSKNVVELNGYSAGTLSKKMKTIVGQEYTISFNHGNRSGGGQNKQFSVQIGNNTTDFTTSTPQSWKGETLTFTATSSETNISFAGKNIAGQNNSYGAIISGISIAAK